MTRGRRRITGVALAALVLWALSGAAWAHTKSTSYTTWRVDGSRVRVSVTLPLVETARLAERGEDQPNNERVGKYLEERLGASADGQACGSRSGSKPLAATSQFRRFELEFECPGERNLTLRSSIFIDLVPSHVSLAQIVPDNGQVTQQLFNRDVQAIAVGSESSALRDAGFMNYVLMGVLHIFTGVDHMSFLLGLLLISRRTRDLIYVVTGFTVGHSITLALAVTGVIRPHAEFIDALVAFTIAMIGAENIVVESRRAGPVACCAGGLLLVLLLTGRLVGGGLPPVLLMGIGLFAASYLMLSGQLRDAARFRIVVTLAFGLVHGFGFAADLLEMQLPPGQLAGILFGFNLGVEAGQLALVLGALLLVGLLARARISLPRPLVVETLSSALVALGMYWFVARSYG